MSDSDLTVADDMVVGIAYQLRLEDGDLIDEASSKEPVQAFVSEIIDDGVVMDLNHPFVGETLFSEVELLSLRQPTNKEITLGHVHGAGHEH